MEALKLKDGSSRLKALKMEALKLKDGSSKIKGSGIFASQPITVFSTQQIPIVFA